MKMGPETHNILHARAINFHQINLFHIIIIKFGGPESKEFEFTLSCQNEQREEGK